MAPHYLTSLKMKTTKILILTALFAAIIFAASAFVNKRASKIKDSGNGFAVIELFTSEGCSSCPPADAVVAKVEKESAGKPIYILAYHVDYWDRLGWKDSFSSAEFTRRQGQYARWLHLESVYTPEIVVNGRTEFVGSEEGTLRNAIKAGLQKEIQVTLTLSDVKAGNNKASLKYQTQGNTAGNVLLLAVVQKSAQTKVERGENGGRTLSHVQIVRAIKSLPIKAPMGVAEINLPDGFNPDGYELIAFVQNTANGEITGAAKSAFSQAL
jgi:hypothetical protein